MIEGLHTVVFAFRDCLLNLGRLGRVHNEVLYAPGRYHDLASSGASAVFRANETLADDALERVGEHRSYLPTLVRREEVYHAVDGLCGVDRVERREHQMPGLRRREGYLGTRGVPDLAYEDYVRVLPQHAPQRSSEGEGVLQALEEVEKAGIPGLLEVLREEDIDGVRYALWNATGWHREYSPPAWRNRATEEQKREGWEMAVRVEKIIATVLHEAHKRQVEEVMDTLEEEPEGGYEWPPY